MRSAVAAIQASATESPCVALIRAAASQDIGQLHDRHEADENGDFLTPMAKNVLDARRPRLVLLEAEKCRRV